MSDEGFSSRIMKKRFKTILAKLEYRLLKECKLVMTPYICAKFLVVRCTTSFKNMATEFSYEFRSYRSIIILRISRTKHVKTERFKSTNFEINTPESSTYRKRIAIAECVSKSSEKNSNLLLWPVLDVIENLC